MKAFIPKKTDSSPVHQSGPFFCQNTPSEDVSVCPDQRVATLKNPFRTLTESPQEAARHV